MGQRLINLISVDQIDNGWIVKLLFTDRNDDFKHTEYYDKKYAVTTYNKAVLGIDAFVNSKKGCFDFERYFDQNNC